MKYAIINLSGKQYQVEEGQTLTVDHLDADFKKDELTVNDVLLYRTDKSIKVGTPTVKGAAVTLKKVEDKKGPKLHVRTYKAKSRYRRHIGHRQHQTVLEVAKISA